MKKIIPPEHPSTSKDGQPMSENGAKYLD